MATANPVSSISSATSIITPSSTIHPTRTTASAPFTTALSAVLESTVQSTTLLAPTTTRQQAQTSTQSHLNTNSIKNSQSQLRPTLSTPVTSVTVSPGDSSGEQENKLGTPVAYALVICTAIAAVLFLVIVTLLAVAIRLARATGSKQKHHR